MIKSHPTLGLLKEFVEGELSPALALTVAAHVDMCRLCQRQVRLLEKEAADALVNLEPAPVDVEMQAMLAAILNSEPTSEQPPKPKVAAHLQLNQQKFLLPRALQQHAAQASTWRQLGHFWRSRVQQGDEWRTSFVYIEKGTRIPEHTHKAREATLVLSGKFVDENDVYHEGDFILRDASHTHTPGAEPDQDCLCFTAVEAPLHFTSGAARMLNPLGQLLY